MYVEGSDLAETLALWEKCKVVFRMSSRSDFKFQIFAENTTAGLVPNDCLGIKK